MSDVNSDINLEKNILEDKSKGLSKNYNSIQLVKSGKFKITK